MRYPLGPDTRIEGGRNSDGDRHAIVVDKSSCKLYEICDTRGRRQALAGRLRRGLVAEEEQAPPRRLDLRRRRRAADPARPAALERGQDGPDRPRDPLHRPTRPRSHHLWPARHDAGSTASLDYPPMGARFRLNASYDASGLSPYAQRVVAAMKTYGLVLADNGSPWYFQGEQNAAWPDRLIEDLKTIPASAFVAVDTSSLQVSPNSAQVR